MEEIKGTPLTEEQKELIGRITGRTEIDTEEAFSKHYHNLSDFISKKKDDYAKEIKPEFDKLMAEETEKKMTPFKKYEQFIKDAGIDIDKVNPVAIKEYLGEQHQDIQPRSVNAVQERQDEIAELGRKVWNTGNQDLKEELVKKTLGI